MELASEIVDVFQRLPARVVAGFDGVLLGGKAERVPAHRVKHVEALGAFVARENIGTGVAFRVPDVKPRRRRIREHIEHVKFRFVRLIFGAERLVVRPEFLPAFFDFGKIVFGRAHVKKVFLPIVDFSRERRKLKSSACCLCLKGKKIFVKIRIAS